MTTTSSCASKIQGLVLATKYTNLRTDRTIWIDRNSPRTFKASRILASRSRGFTRTRLPSSTEFCLPASSWFNGGNDPHESLPLPVCYNLSIAKILHMGWAIAEATWRPQNHFKSTNFSQLSQGVAARLHFSTSRTQTNVAYSSYIYSLGASRCERPKRLYIELYSRKYATS